MGSISYAVAAYFYGVLAEKLSPDALMPCYMLGTVVCIVCVLLMPDPYAGMDAAGLRAGRARTSYRQMLTGNPALLFFLLAVLMNGIGYTASYTFILRIV